MSRRIMIESMQRAMGLAVCLWVLVSLLAGGILLARDEWRLQRKKPKPADLRA